LAARRKPVDVPCAGRDLLLPRQVDRCAHLLRNRDGEVVRARLVDLEICSTAAIRSAGSVIDHPSKAAFAAATAASVSALSPSEIVAQTSSVEGSMTGKSFGRAGATQAPFM
jgi:hypothetical protein